jgi:hypothetical protein
MGLGNYLNKQHSCNLLSRRSSILQVPSGWCTVIAVARICASMAASDRQSGPGEISQVVNEASGVCLPISRTRRTPARNVAQPFSVARKFCRMRTGTRIGRGERARIVRKFERHALTQAYTAPILW